MTVCVVVPNGRWNLSPLFTAIREFHPGAAVVAVWCGDPHLRPVLPDAARWGDVDIQEPSGFGWNRLLVALAPRSYEWCRTAAVVAALLDAGAESVTVVRAGSVAVLGPIAKRPAGSAVELAVRTDQSLPIDGCAPTEADLVRMGRHSLAVARFGPGGQQALRWLADHVLDGSEHIGPLIDRMAELFGSTAFPRNSVLPVGWRDLAASPPGIVDLDHLDRDEPWHLRFGSTPARVRLSADAELAAMVAAGWPQCHGEPLDVFLPGAIPVAGPVRSLMRSALIAAQSGLATMPPEPFGPTNSAVLSWLEESSPSGVDIGRYWLAVREERPDLLTAFPQPEAKDAAGLLQWAGVSWRLEQRSALLRGHVTATFADPAAGDPGHAIESVGNDPTGVNVLGYLDFDQSQGHIAREIVAALTAAAVPVAALNHHRSLGSKRPEPFSTERSARFATNIVVVNADQFLFVVSDHGESLLRDRHTIAYWFWELEHVTAPMVKAIDDVDEIWTGSVFVADAFAAVTNKPVRCVPLPVAEPQPSARDRASFGIDETRFVFLTTFDQFSVPERKNPFGVIDAFTSAFTDGEGPLLWIKTMNGDRGWRNHERLLLAASQRSDIVIWDKHLSRPDQMAVVAAADCLVSLHRSEGLGLHCAEAMWMSKPVIATRYSGNVDFMDDSCAAMVGFDMIAVQHGEGIYPPEASWADPHIDEAALWMQRLATDSALAADLGRAARARMQSQMSMADTGRMMAEIARLQPMTATTRRG